MQNKLFQQPYLWIGLFGALFFLTQVHRYIEWPTQLGPLGLPNWLLWLMAVHALLILLLYFFIKKYWQ